MQSNIWRQLWLRWKKQRQKRWRWQPLWLTSNCLLLVAMQARLGLELGPSRAQTLTNRSKPFGPFLIVDSLSHVVVVAGQGVQKERQHAQLEVRYVNPKLFNPSLYQPPCLAKDKSFFTPETSTRFYFQKEDTLNLKALNLKNLEVTVFKKSEKKTFCPLVWGLRIKS